MATISVVCPQCESQYQVDAALAGKRMRCPNSICRTVFEVKVPSAPEETSTNQRDTEAQRPEGARADGGTRRANEGESAPSSEANKAPTPVAPPRPKQQTGNVADLLPLLPAQPVTPREPAAAPPAQPTPPRKVKTEPAHALVPSWQGAPPPVRGQTVETPVSLPSLSPRADFPDFSELESEAGSEGGPSPNAEAAGAVTDAVTPSENATSVSLFPEEPIHGARKRNLYVMLLLVLILAGLGVGALYLVQRRQAGDEAEQYQLALDAYKKKDYAQAANLLQALSRDFPDSGKKQEYRFLTELSDLRAAVHRPSTDPAEVTRSLERVLEFLATYQNDPRMKDHHADLWQSLEHLSQDFIALAEQHSKRDLLPLAGRAWKEAEKFTPPPDISLKDVRATFTREYARVNEALAQKEYREQSLVMLRALLGRPSAQSIEEAFALIQSRKLEGNEVAAQIIADLKTAHLESIAFFKSDKAPASKSSDDPMIQNVVFAPSSVRSEKAGPKRDQPILCLARGVLYALNPSDGEIHWARRLGADARHLPLRVAGTKEQPETLIASITDHPAIVALDGANGKELWRHPLTSPCVASPIRVEGRLLVPTVSGRVDDLDLATGKLAGFYDLDQPLLLGGVHQPGTSLVYLPATQTCLYVLDVAKQRCEQILYLRHDVRSLSGLPLIVPHAEGGDDKDLRASLLVSLAEGEKGELRRYTLPIKSGDAKPVETVPLPGISSYPPYRVGDRIGIAGDAGSFSLFGLRSQGDSLLYPLVPEVPTRSGGANSSRSLIAAADGQTWIVLSNGRLLRYSVGISQKEGLRVAVDWKPGILLGSPLHVAESIESPNESLLCLTTQLPDEPTCLATLVDRSTGKIRWQRELGQISQGPLKLVGKDWVLHGPRGLHRLRLPEKGATWTTGSVEPMVKLPTNVHAYWPESMPSPSVFTWSSTPADPLRLHILEEGKATTRSWKLPHLPRGTWTPHGKHFVIPLADGELYALAESGEKIQKLDAWRGKGVEEQLPGHVVSLSDTAFAFTDGNLTLTLWNWAEMGAAPRPGATYQSAQRIVAAPTKVKLKDGTMTLVVADASNQLTLLDAGSLKVIRSWTLPGKLTAGPVVRGSGVLCVVGKNRLVYIEPEKTNITGEHVALAQIVGIPEAFDGQLLVADLAGQITWLDLVADLPPVRRTYEIQAAVVPSATPVKWDNQVLVSLSDGTLMIVPTK